MRPLLLLAAASLLHKRAPSPMPRWCVHRSALLIDTHNDVPSRTVDGFDIGPRAPDGQTDTVRLKEGGVGAQFFAAFVDSEYVKGNRSADRALAMIDTIRYDIIGKYPNDFMRSREAPRTSKKRIVKVKSPR